MILRTEGLYLAGRDCGEMGPESEGAEAEGLGDFGLLVVERQEMNDLKSGGNREGTSEMPEVWSFQGADSENLIHLWCEPPAWVDPVDPGKEISNPSPGPFSSQSCPELSLQKVGRVEPFDP